MKLSVGDRAFSPGSFLVASWLGFGAFTARVQSLVGKLRPCKPYSAAKLKKRDFSPEGRERRSHTVTPGRTHTALHLAGRMRGLSPILNHRGRAM